jgi:hypothetical protein
VVITGTGLAFRCGAIQERVPSTDGGMTTESTLPNSTAVAEADVGDAAEADVVAGDGAGPGRV